MVLTKIKEDNLQVRRWQHIRMILISTNDYKQLFGEKDKYQIKTAVTWFNPTHMTPDPWTSLPAAAAHKWNSQIMFCFIISYILSHFQHTVTSSLHITLVLMNRYQYRLQYRLFPFTQHPLTLKDYVKQPGQKIHFFKEPQLCHHNSEVNFCEACITSGSKVMTVIKLSSCVTFIALSLRGSVESS